MSFTEPKPDYRAIPPAVLDEKLRDLGYHVNVQDEPFSVISGLFVSMAEQIEYLKQELAKSKKQP